MITKQDETAIDNLLKKMTDAWAAGDGRLYGSLFWEDARYVEAPGFRAVGATMIGERHQQIFDSFFKNTRIGGDYPRSIQALTPQVVLIHSEGNVLFPGESAKKVKPNGLVAMCLLKKNDVWKVAAFQNTPTGKFRGLKFMFRFFFSRLYLFRTKWANKKSAL
jgi:uncharacterized protein (TIGR02246 family)